MKTHGHLKREHSIAQAKRVSLDQAPAGNVIPIEAVQIR
jgi:hypothetical protein